MVKDQSSAFTNFMLSGYALHEIIYDDTGIPCDYRVLDVNADFEKLTGLKDEDVIGKTLGELMSDTDKSWLDTYGSVVRTGIPVTFEKYAAGLGKHFEITAMASKKDRFAVMFNEIQGAAPEKTIQPRSQRKLSTLLNKLPGMAYQCNHNSLWSMRYVSRGALALTGYKPEDLLSGRISYNDLIHPSDRQHIRDRVNTAIKENRSFQVEYRLRTADGQEKWVREQGGLAHANSQEPVILEGLIIDITDRKTTEAALQEITERMSMALDETDQGLWDWDIQAGKIEYDPNWARVLGFQAGEKGFNLDWWKQNVAPETISEFEAALQEYFTGQSKYYELEYRIKNKNGDWRWVRSRGKCVSWDSNRQPQRIIGTNQDITERKMLEAQFMQAQKMEAIGRLSGGVAHDFNNYLMTIIGCTEMLQADLSATFSSRELLDEILKAGKNATALIRQLLAFSRHQIFELEVIDLNSEINSFKNMLHHIIGEDIRIETSLTTDQVTLKADRTQLQQVMMNLAVNARDAMPRGGTLTIETEHVNLDESYGREHGVDFTPGPYVMLAISDTGTGMDRRTREKVFEPFFTTKETEKGTGLGLATVYGIIKQSNGYIWVYSEPDQGATFKIHLPATREKPEHKTAPQQESLSQLPCDKTILLVEDDVNVRSLLIRVLERHGYTVLAAPDGGVAENLCREAEQPIDLMITDMIMPGICGNELAERVKTIQPDMKILFMSGYANSTMITQGILHESSHFIQKPISPKDLGERIKKILFL